MDRIGQEIESVIKAHLSRTGVQIPVSGSLRLNQEVGLDSIAIVELLFDCEKKFDVTVAQQLFDGGDLTVERVVAVFRAAVLERDGAAAVATSGGAAAQ